MLIQHAFPLFFASYFEMSRWGSRKWRRFTYTVKPVLSRHRIKRTPSIDRFHSRGKQLCKFVGTKIFFYIRKVSIPNWCFLVHQHGRRFHCFVHRYGRRDVRWKRSIKRIVAEVPKFVSLIYFKWNINWYKRTPVLSGCGHLKSTWNGYFCCCQPVLRWLNTVLQAVSGNSRDGACFKLNKQTWRRKKQWYTEDDFSKSTH